MRRELAFLLPLALLSCGPITTHVEVRSTSSGQFPSVASVLHYTGGFADFRSTFSTTIQAEGADPERVESAKMKAFSVTVTSPAPEDPSFRGLTFLRSMRIVFHAEGLSDLTVAELADFSVKQETYVFPVNTKMELKAYVTSQSLKVTIEADGDLPPVPHVAKAQLVLDVKAVLLK